jgi:hypothetical protein
LGYWFFEDIEVGFLFDFGPEPEAKGKAFDNRRRKNLRNLDNLRPEESFEGLGYSEKGYLHQELQNRAGDERNG